MGVRRSGPKLGGIMPDIARLMAKIEAGKIMSAELADLIAAVVSSEADNARIAVIDGKEYTVPLKEIIDMEEFASATTNFGNTIHAAILKEIKLHEQELAEALSS
jgi:hypothetical protein